MVLSATAAEGLNLIAGVSCVETLSIFGATEQKQNVWMCVCILMFLECGCVADSCL